MDKVKSLGGDAPVTQVLKKSKLDFSLLFENGDSSKPTTNMKPSRIELLRYLDVDGVAENVTFWHGGKMLNQGFQRLQRSLETIQTSSVRSERAFSHGQFECRGKENMSD
eukprot:snap_masked-scaffold_1-processed-gene-0.29-mRNA-1 protein AED:1.00 eAED:1.00 QI:0/0/0/0/1/1/2/0/109